MIYDIRQITTYHYASHVAYARHVLRLTPIDRPGSSPVPSALKLPQASACGIFFVIAARPGGVPWRRGRAMRHGAPRGGTPHALRSNRPLRDSPSGTASDTG